MSSKLTFVIEDNTVTSDLLTHKISKIQGMEAKQFSSAEEAFAKISDQPDFILLDNFLDGVNGVEFIDKFLNACPAAKIIVLSNQATVSKYEEDALKEKAIDWFKKDGDGIKAALDKIQKLSQASVTSRDSYNINL